MDSKVSPMANDISAAPKESDDSISVEGGTARDQRDMYRLGKHQSLRVELFHDIGEAAAYIAQRIFGHFSTFGFAMVLMSSWEAELAYANLPEKKVGDFILT